MAANNNRPIFTGKILNGYGASALTTANTAVDGSGSLLLIHTASAQGGPVRKVFWRPLGTNVATVGRLFRYDGSTYQLVDEITLSATTVSQVAALPPYVMAFNETLQANEKLYVTIGTTVSAGFHVGTFGGDFAVMS